ncbi:MAG: hypothetical protein LBO79_04995, partial [Zoogloeaceae bacterium]|nr:hypothetical protein [Zoogloeaceae bacterium]
KACARKPDRRACSASPTNCSGGEYRRINSPPWNNPTASDAAHGFRSSLRDWAGETAAYPREVGEHALEHRLAGVAEAAHQRGGLPEKRRRLADWARYCGTASGTAAAVVPIRGRATEKGVA